MMASRSFVLASSLRPKACFLCISTQVVYRVKMAILRDYLGGRGCTVLINYDERLVNVANARYKKKKRLQVLNSQTRSSLSH